MNSSTKKIMANDANANDKFGSAASLSGNLLAVGTPCHNEQGAVYIFEKDSKGYWDQVAEVIAPNRDKGDNFGHAVSLDGNLLAVGAPNEGENNSGAVYIFERQGKEWKLVREENGDVRQGNEYFGYSVSLDGDRLLVGAYGEGKTAGAAYVFDAPPDKDYRSEWEREKLMAHDHLDHPGFGWSVSLDGDMVIVGATHDKSEMPGAAYLFERQDTGRWREVQRVLAEEQQAGNNFGHSVSLDGKVAIVGTYGQYGDGVAYLYEREANVWTKKQVLQACDRRPGDGFSYSVSLNGTVAAVGAPYQYTDENRLGGGAVYIFQRLSNGIWVEVLKVVEKDSKIDRDDLFGASLSLDGDLVLVGAPGQDGHAENTGAAHIVQYQQESGPSSERTKLACGSTPIGDTNWQQVKGENEIFVEIDTSAAGFSETPTYFTTLAGEKSLQYVIGMTSIYDASKDGFRVYVESSSITPDKANDRQWHLNWFAVSKNGIIPCEMDGSGKQAFKIASGSTKPGETNWNTRDNGSVRVDIDTSASGFTKAPKYFTSLGGDPIDTSIRGASAVYKARAENFRVYINASDTLTAELANEQKLHINWFAVSDEGVVEL